MSYQLQAETGLKSPDDAARQARALLGQALDDDPSNARALALSAIIDWQQAFQTFGPTDARTDDAFAALRAVVGKAPNVSALYGAIANGTVRDGDAAETLDWIEKGLEVDPLSARLNL